MTVRRQLINFGDSSCDFRISAGAFNELPRMLRGAVGRPKRAVIVTEDALAPELGVTVSRALVDAGFRVDDLSLPSGERIATVAYAAQLYDALDRCAITGDDLIVALGGAEVCSLVTFCAQSWCGRTASVLLPTTLDAMATVATSMVALDTSSSPEMVSVPARPSMTVCDLDLVMGAPLEQNGLGYVTIAAAHLAESRKYWNEFAALAPNLPAGGEITFIDALCNTQTSRLNSVKSSMPSVRSALQFGQVTAHALRSCLGEGIPWYRLLAEGMRFEARMAVDAMGFSVDEVFALDDRLEELGVDEPAFSLDVTRFVTALRESRLKRTNRFMFPLPKCPGTIRLAVVEDEVLERHAEAYLASRAELLDEDA